MKTRTTQILYAYWNEVRRGRLAPRRFDIEPARIAGILAETMILERMDDGAIRFRLAGTRIAEQFATEFRGHDFLALWSQDDRRTLAELFQRLTEQGGAGVLTLEALSCEGRRVSFEAVLLPLIHTREVVDRFLGALTCIQAPGWLGSEPLVTLRLVNSEVIWPDGRPHALASRMSQPPVLTPHLAHGRLVRFDRRQFRVLDGGRTGEETDA